MIYALVATNLSWAALAAFFVRRALAREDAHGTLVKHLWDSHLADVQVWANRVQAPDVAVAQSIDPGEMTRQFTMYDDDDDLVKAFKELE